MSLLLRYRNSRNTLNNPVCNALGKINPDDAIYKGLTTVDKSQVFSKLYNKIRFKGDIYLIPIDLSDAIKHNLDSSCDKILDDFFKGINVNLIEFDLALNTSKFDILTAKLIRHPVTFKEVNLEVKLDPYILIEGTYQFTGGIGPLDIEEPNDTVCTSEYVVFSFTVNNLKHELPIYKSKDLNITFESSEILIESDLDGIPIRYSVEDLFDKEPLVMREKETKESEEEIVFE